MERTLMLAVYTLLVLVGYAVGALHTSALRWAREHRPLPPATPRAIARAARRARRELSDFSGVRPAREQGVRVTSVRLVEPTHVFRDNPPRMERLPSVDDFDEENTR
jgi:hypothetical protein